MLSATYSITDVKNELGKAYSFYGYTLDAEFVTDLTRSIEDVMRRVIKSQIGSTFYTQIQTKNKVDLTAQEEYIYWAEIYFTCFYFLKWKLLGVDGQASSSGSSGTLKVEGYTKTLGDGGSSSENSGSGFRSYFLKRAKEYMNLAGYPLGIVFRGNSLFALNDGLIEEYE